MKPFFLIVLIFLTAPFYLLAQDASFHLKSIPSGGVLLDKGWKFQAGDNTEWMKPEYDDNEWQAINPTDEIHNLVQLRKAEIGWFRLHLKVDSSQLNKLIALLIRQIGASEFYLNGKLVFRFGIVSKDPKKEIIFNPNNKPYNFQLSSNTNQLIAIRYSFTQSNPYFKNQGVGNPTLVLQLMSVEGAINGLVHEKSYSSALTFAEVGFLFLLFLIHFFFYLSYPEKKTNLFHSLFALCLMFYYWLWFLSYNVPREGHSFFVLNLLSLVIGIPGLFLALTAVYSHARQQRGWLYRLTFLCMLLTFPTARWPYEWGWITCYVYVSLVILDAVRVSALAVKRKVSGSRIIFTGWVIFLLLFGVSILITYGVIKPADLGPNYKYIEDFTYNAGFLFLWLPFSIILANEFAQTNRSLKQQLLEVEKLSEKTIIQEQEKQQILATQNERLEQEVTQRTTELKQSLEELKSTQAQLIQSEKMASLGELTAGIAHEIQNPLNFVNNFSEVSVELLGELKEGPLQKLQETDRTEADEIVDGLTQNLQKITHHGKRADAIVKGMLQHSRVNTGERQLTDINALADEYLRLSYHGMRAKDKTFNITIETYFDESIGKVSIVPQDIGRALLNLFNNAFYAVQEKKKGIPEGYEPKVSVSTRRMENQLEIHVQDNGVGIPQQVINKIFQPFFTTKPTGEGTGLGLSLSYDIAKAHGGEIRVETKEGEYAAFIVQLPA